MPNSKFVIKGSLPSLNEYTLENRRNKYKANQMKQDSQMIVNAYIRKWKVPKYNNKIKLFIKWYEKDNRKDADNVSFAVKFILDAMVKSKVIPNDTRKYVDKIYHEVYVDKNNPRIEVYIIDEAPKS